MVMATMAVYRPHLEQCNLCTDFLSSYPDIKTKYKKSCIFIQNWEIIVEFDI